MSWVSPDPIPLRDDGVDASPAVDESAALAALKAAIADYETSKKQPAKAEAALALLRASTTPLGTGAVPARQAWPADVVVWCLPFASGRAVADIRSHTYRSSGGTTENLWWQAGLATLAAMVVRVEGAMFTDAHGELLQFTGTFDERLAAAERIPQAMQEYLVAELNRRDDLDPLGLAPPA